MKQHPIIAELKVNEDGSLIVYKNKPVEVITYTNTGRENYVCKKVHFMSRTHNVAKLVCECYHGMRKDMSYTIQRKDFDTNNYHYTNLFWGKRGARLIKKRSKLSSIKDSEVTEIYRRIRAGESLRAIAKSYNTSDMTIHRVKKAREKVITECAKHLGYDSALMAEQKIGRFEFEKEVDKLIKDM